MRLEELLHLLVFLGLIQTSCVGQAAAETMDSRQLRQASSNMYDQMPLDILKNVRDRLSLLGSISKAHSSGKLLADLLKTTNPSVSRRKRFNLSWRGERPESEAVDYGPLYSISADDWNDDFDQERLPRWRKDVEFLIRKRQRRNCDTSRITLHTLIEYLKTGRICGRRVAHVRFGLGGRRR